MGLGLTMYMKLTLAIIISISTSLIAREEVRVPTSNLDSGQNYAEPSAQKTWRSEADTRKTGADYNAEQRRLYESNATAAAAR